MSRSSKTTSGFFACCARFSVRPPTRLSIARTAKPRSTSRSTMWLPMNPAPPVTTATGFIGTGGPAPRTPSGISCGLQFLEPADVEVERILHAVRQLALLERLAKVAHRVFHVVPGLEVEH